MSEHLKQTFLEKLNLIYPGQFKVEKRTGGIPSYAAIFPAKNKRFGDITIVGDLEQWEDEADYDEIKFDEDNYREYGGDFADYCEDISFEFETKRSRSLFTPTMIFEYLEKIFNDEILFYWSWSFKKKFYGNFYKREVFEKMIHEGRIRVSKNYKLCFWSGNYPLNHKE